MKLKHLVRIGCAASIALLISAPLSPASILLSAENFAVLGGTAITSTGVAGTIIRNGNIGISPGATSGITGFPPAVIENGTIVATGPVTHQARLDLIKAQVGLAGMPSDKTLSNVNLGGKTLRPGVYTFDGAAMLTGDLVLDARGRNGAFWVFQIATALTTSVNSSVTLINPGSNGGRDCGIFWNAGSGITIGANNRIAGNYLAGTSITFGAKTYGSGHALAQAGVSLDNNQLNATGGPGDTAWSGSLKYNASGAVVPNPALAFKVFGNSTRTTQTTPISIYGNATVTAADIQWRVNGGLWHNVEVGYAGKWQFSVSVDNLDFGSNPIDIRARDNHGHETASKQLILRHVR